MATRARLVELARLSRLPERAGSTWRPRTAVLFALPARLDQHPLRRTADLDAKVPGVRRGESGILTHFDFYQRMQRLRDDAASR